MTQPITVLMAVHNGDAFLRASVASVLSQSRTDFQFIVVDDASTDGSSRILASAADHDSRMLIIRNSSTLGLTRSLNIGLRAATGEYVARLDADDFATPRRLELQAAFLRAHPDHVLVGGRERVIDSTGRELRLGRGALSSVPFHHLSYFAPPIVHSSAMFRRTAGGTGVAYDESCKTAQDFELWQRLLRFGKGCRLPDLLVHLSEHESSISQRRKSEQADTAIMISARSLARDFPQVDPGRLTDLAAFAVAGRLAGCADLASIVDTALEVEACFLRQSNAGHRESREVCALTVNRILKGAAKAGYKGSTGTLAGLTRLFFRRPIMTTREIIAMGGRRKW